MRPRLKFKMADFPDGQAKDVTGDIEWCEEGHSAFITITGQGLELSLVEWTVEQLNGLEELAGSLGERLKNQLAEVGRREFMTTKNAACRQGTERLCQTNSEFCLADLPDGKVQVSRPAPQTPSGERRKTIWVVGPCVPPTPEQPMTWDELTVWTQGLREQGFRVEISAFR